MKSGLFIFWLMEKCCVCFNIVWVSVCDIGKQFHSSVVYAAYLLCSLVCVE